MRVALIVSVLALASVGQDVQHAPTVAQCQADQRVWSSELEDDSQLKPEIDVLDKWTREMRDCEKVDPDHKFNYYNAVWEIDGEMLLRMTHFLSRHNLMTDFKTEDAAGKR